MQKWHTLTSELLHEQALLGTRITGPVLCDMYNNGHAVIEIHNGEIIAFSALWETTDKSWRELGSVWVSKKYRNHKLGSKIFLKCASLSTVGIFLITHNPKIMHLCRQAGFEESTIDTWDKVPCAISCGPCDRGTNRLHCPMRATKECSLFFKAGKSKPS